MTAHLAPVAGPRVAVETMRARYDEVRSRARQHWRTCWAQRFTGAFCLSCAEWDTEEALAERALKRAIEQEARRDQPNTATASAAHAETP